MQLGIFAKTFERPDAAQTLRAVAEAGYETTQFNLSVVGLPTVPSTIPAEVVADVRRAVDSTGVTLSAISATFNAAHPDADHRSLYVLRFPVVAEFAAQLGIPVITLGSGSRDPHDMWRWHVDNATQEAWDDSREVLTAVAEIAADHGVRVAVEPEHSNVVTTAELGVRMLDEVGSPALGVIYDAANLLDPDHFDPAAAAEQIRADVLLLGSRITLAHAKELRAHRVPAPAGEGLLPWPTVLDALTDIGFDGSVIVHGLAEAGARTALDTLRRAQPQRA